MKQKTAIILGATGLTGSCLLSILLKSSVYTKVKVFTRTSTGLQHEKLEEISCDLLKLNDYATFFYADEVFCCIGTTKKKTPNRDLYRQIDFGIPVNAAQLAQENGISTFVVISAIGSNINSSTFYSRTKGEMEEAVLDKSIDNILVIRPSVIYGDRKESRFMEKLAVKFLAIIKFFLIGSLSKYRAISGEKLAKFIYSATNNLKGNNILYTNTKFGV